MKPPGQRYLKLFKRCKELENWVIGIITDFNNRLSNTSLLIIQIMAVIEILKKKEIITDQEIQEAVEAINEKTRLQIGEGAGVDTPTGDDSVPQEEEVVCESDSGDSISERSS